jgi:hypothetical protein
MKKGVVAIAVAVLALLAWLWFAKTRPEPPATGIQPPEESVAHQNAPVAKAFSTASPQVKTVIASNFAAPAPQTVFFTPPPKPTIAPAGKPFPLEYTNLPPDIVLDNVRHAIRDFGAMFSGNPVGVNSEITSQLSGNNPKQVNFIRPEAGMRLNDQGELIDPWGTPYFFHQVSGTEMEIRSAGPDKILWTADDLITK